MAVLREASAHADDVLNLLTNGDFELVRKLTRPLLRSFLTTAIERVRTVLTLNHTSVPPLPRHLHAV
jgi:hypothetical protein